MNCEFLQDSCGESDSHMVQCSIAARSIQIYSMELNQEIVLEDSYGKRRTHVVVSCALCKKLFYKPKRFLYRRSKHCCSAKCAALIQERKVETACAFCNKKINVKFSRTTNKSGLNFCSRKCKEKAQSIESGILTCAHYGTGTSQAREIAFRNYGEKCEWCSDTLLLDVHHLDHNWMNNSIQNLMVLCPYCHALETRNVIAIGIDRKIIINTSIEQLESHFTRLGIEIASLLSKTAQIKRNKINKLCKKCGAELTGRHCRNCPKPNKLISKDELVEKLKLQTKAELALAIGVHQNTIYRWCHKYKILP